MGPIPFHFENPVPLLLLPVLWGSLLFIRHRRRRRRTREHGTLVLPGAARLTGQGRRSLRLRLLPVVRWSRVLALSLGIVALSRPYAERMEAGEQAGIDLVVALDMSGSMRAVDVTTADLARLQARGREPDNRIDIAISVLGDFISSRTRDRIGLVIFAREAYTLFPLTRDHHTANKMVQRLTLGDIDPAGTAIGNALGRAVTLMRGSDSTTRAIILITDGDNRGGNIAPMEAARIAASKGIVVFPIIVGTEDKSMEAVGPDLLGRRMVYRPVHYPTDPELMRQMAELTGGKDFHAQNRQELEEDFQEILDALPRTVSEDIPFSHKRAHFPLFLNGMLLLLLCEHLLKMFYLRKFP